MSKSQPSNPSLPLADHVSESVDVIAAFQMAHEYGASPLQRMIDSVTEHLGRPLVVAMVFLGLGVWLAATFVLVGLDVTSASFTWLELSATVVALLVAMLILVTQRRQDKLSERRAQLTLELAILADRKTAKLIALMEEMRRDHPDLRNRDDAESRDMAEPVDPQTVLDAIDERANAGAANKASRPTRPDAGQ